MHNSPKNILKKSRDKFLASITQSLSQMNSKIEAIHQSQIDSDRIQAKLYQQLNERIINSGIIHLSEHEILVKLSNGLKMYLDPKDISVVPHLALDGIWEPQITKAWLSVLNPGDTIFDIGANFGYFGLCAAHKTDKKKSKIVFFEANPELIPYINKTLSTNFYVEQSRVENLAVAEAEGTVTLNILKDYIGSSSLHSLEHLNKFMESKMNLRSEKKVKVKSVSIDAYCQANKISAVNLIKMDIEGYEDKAYQGMRETVRSSPNLILFMEFTKDSYENPKQFYEQILKDFGQVYIIDKQGNLSKPKSDTYDSVIGSADDWVMPVFAKNKNLA